MDFEEEDKEIHSKQKTTFETKAKSILIENKNKNI
jgi:hypothetical protein